MQSASQNYKFTMKQILRNRSYMRVTIGVINQEAQRTAYVSNSESCAYFSNLIKPFDNYGVDYLYATAEQNYSIVDGSMAFLPRNKEDIILNAGIVTESILGFVQINFSIYYDVKGLTIDFGKAYPIDFTIESDNNTVTITGNNQQRFITEEIFLGATYIRIIPTSMKNGNVRLRIHQITMGVGIYFDNKKILTSSLKDYISSVSEDMPAIDFSLTVDNQDGTFDIENQESSINFLETGQECRVEYGYEISESIIEWIPGAKLFLKAWSADNIQMKCAAVDRFEYMQSTYYKGQYYQDGISLYNLALDVLVDAGVDPRDYWIDGYLKNIMVHNPLPVCSHKEALQIIANAGRCTLSQDRQAKIYMKSSFIPDMTASSDNATSFSNTGNVLNDGAKNIYASGALNVTDTNGGSYFLPRSVGYLNTGYVSQEVSDVSGLFTVNPTITISLEASFKCFSLTVLFAGNTPDEFIIHTFLEDSHIEDIMVTDILVETLISHEFTDFDKMILEFIKAPSHNRIMVDYIEFGEVTDYTLEKTLDLSKIPTGNKLEKVKELQIIRTMYNQSSEAKELISETVIASGTSNEYIFDFSNASYGFTCILDGAQAGQSVEIVDSGAYFVNVVLHGFTVVTEVSLSITGYEYITTTAKTIQTINSTGKVETWNNPLISSMQHAMDIGEWIGAHMLADKDYNISYRGDPRIDANDILFMENDYVSAMKIRIYEHTLNFNGSLSGTIKARRIVDVDST